MTGTPDAGAEPASPDAGAEPASPDAGALTFDVTVDRRQLQVRAAFTVDPGACLALVGPSGAGKSTVLAAVAGLVVPRAGHVTLAGRPLTIGPEGSSISARGARRRPRVRSVPLHRRGIGLLTQRPALFPHLSAAANIGYGFPPGSGDDVVGSLAQALGLTDLLDARPARLSGGQRQRVALARVLAGDPGAVLLDEPLSALDQELRVRIADWVVGEVARRQVPCILVTHDIAEAQRCAGRIALFDAGTTVQVDTPANLVQAPTSRRAATLVGYRTFVPVALCTPTMSLPPPGAVTVGIHPDLVALAGAPRPGAELEGVVRALVAVGATTEVTMVLADGSELSMRGVPGHRALRIGDAVSVSVYQPPCFGADGSLLGQWGAAQPSPTPAAP